MLVLGIDAHKRTHTVVAVDEAGRKLGQYTTTSATTADHLETASANGRCDGAPNEATAQRWRLRAVVVQRDASALGELSTNDIDRLADSFRRYADAVRRAPPMTRTGAHP